MKSLISSGRESGGGYHVCAELCKQLRQFHGFCEGVEGFLSEEGVQPGETFLKS